MIRENGADGIVTLHWKTIDKTAVSGKDYKGGNQETWAPKAATDFRFVFVY